MLRGSPEIKDVCDHKNRWFSNHLIRWMKPTTGESNDYAPTPRTKRCDGTHRVWLSVQKHGRSDALPSLPSRPESGRIHISRIAGWFWCADESSALVNACGDCAPYGNHSGSCKTRFGSRKLQLHLLTGAKHPFAWSVRSSVPRHPQAASLLTGAKHPFAWSVRSSVPRHPQAASTSERVEEEG